MPNDLSHQAALLRQIMDWDRMRADLPRCESAISGVGPVVSMVEDNLPGLTDRGADCQPDCGGWMPMRFTFLIGDEQGQGTHRSGLVAATALVWNSTAFA